MLPENEKLKNNDSNDNDGLKTEGPLSEKDEVKKAEDRSRKLQDEASVKSDLKNRTK